MNALLRHRLAQPLTLGQFIHLLSGVRPTLTRQLILSDDLLSSAEREDLFTYQGFKGPCWMIGPDAAAAVLAHYDASELPMKPGEQPGTVPRARRYVGNAERVRAVMRVRDPTFDLFRQERAGVPASAPGSSVRA